MEADEYYYWCFICKKECLVLDSDDGELLCECCKSTFIEELPDKKPKEIFKTFVEINNFQKTFEEEKKNIHNNENNDKENLAKSEEYSQTTTNELFLENNLDNTNLNNENSNLININVNSFSNRPIQLQNEIDDPRNFDPINSNNHERRNSEISSVSFSHQGGNTLIQMQISGLEPNENTNNFTNGISNMINSIFSAISGNNSNNILNISNNTVSFNLTGLLGSHANSLVQGLHNINLNSYLGRNINENAFENILNIIMRSDRSNPPASEEVIKSLERIEINEENYDNYSKENCVICADDYLLKQKLICLTCSHFFHEECIITWLKKRNQCPVCRKELKTDDENYEKRRSENRSILNNLMRSNNNNDLNNDGNGDLI